MHFAGRARVEPFPHWKSIRFIIQNHRSSAERHKLAHRSYLKLVCKHSALLAAESYSRRILRFFSNPTVYIYTSTHIDLHYSQYFINNACRYALSLSTRARARK